MCLQTYLDFMSFPASFKTRTAGAVVESFLGPAPDRYAIIFTPANAGQITLGTTPDLIEGQGFLRGNAKAPLVITSEKYGDLPQEEWFCIADIAGRTFAFVEVMFPRKFMVRDGESRRVTESAHRG